MEERPLKHLRLSRRLFRATLKTKLTPFAKDKLAILERAQIYSESEGELNICSIALLCHRFCICSLKLLAGNSFVLWPIPQAAS